MSSARNYLRAIARRRYRQQRPDMRHVVAERPERLPAATCPVRGCKWVGSPHRDGRAVKKHVLINHPRSKAAGELRARVEGAAEWGKITQAEADVYRAASRKGRRRARQ